MPRKLTTKEFINKAKNVHGNIYDYSFVNYAGSHCDIDIICKEHGKFQQTPNIHLSGSGCQKCARVYRWNTEEWIDAVKAIHGDLYDYSLVEYSNHNTLVKIKCTIHGIFTQLPNNHLNGGYGCPDCAIINIGNQNNTNARKRFIDKSIRVHNDKYDYTSTKYVDSKSKIEINCPIHGVFTQLPYNHLNGCGCPHCSASKGEIKIRQYLVDNDIKFKTQFAFTDCRNIKLLPFDFYIPSKNLLIEYDGIQHFEPREYFGGVEAFNDIKVRDNIKNKYSNSKNVELLRISYMDFDDIEFILKNSIK